VAVDNSGSKRRASRVYLTDANVGKVAALIVLAHRKFTLKRHLNDTGPLGRGEYC
jgi:hypothetical protein